MISGVFTAKIHMSDVCMIVQKSWRKREGRGDREGFRGERRMEARDSDRDEKQEKCSRKRERPRGKAREIASGRVGVVSLLLHL